MFEDIALEVARIERLALDAVRMKIASRQLGEAWRDLPHDLPEDRPLDRAQPANDAT